MMLQVVAQHKHLCDYCSLEQIMKKQQLHKYIHKHLYDCHLSFSRFSRVDTRKHFPTKQDFRLGKFGKVICPSSSLLENILVLTFHLDKLDKNNILLKNLTTSGIVTGKVDENNTSARKKVGKNNIFTWTNILTHTKLWHKFCEHFYSIFLSKQHFHYDNVD